MEKLLGKWVFECVEYPDLEKGGLHKHYADDEMFEDDPFIPKTAYLFLDDGTVKAGITFTDGYTKEVEKECKKHKFEYDKDGFIWMDFKKWEIVDGVIKSDIACDMEMQNDGILGQNNFGTLKIEGDFLVVNQLIGFLYMKKA